jgi:hypothetical protein
VTILEDIFGWVRIFNTVWAFFLFMGLVYWGVMDLLLTNRCKNHHSDAERQAWSSAAYAGVLAFLVSVLEVFLRDVPVGWRVLAIVPFLAQCSYALRLGARRVRMHKRLVETGNCR